MVIQLCETKRLDYTILHEKYENKIEQMRAKFPKSAKMKAKYDVHSR